MLNLQEVAQELEARLASLVPAGAIRAGAPATAPSARYATDPHWKDLVLFYEYFHGDNGRGVGASHQTGWTALVRALHRGPDPPPHRSRRPDAKSAHPQPSRGASMTTIPINDHTEWLEADGLGGFASGTTSGIRTRRYHALLLAATTPPTGRMVLVNGVDAWVEPQTGTHGGSGQEYLTRQRYAPGVVAPEQGATLESFTHEPWPTWIYRLADGTRIEHEIFVPARSAFVALRWKVLDGPAGLVLKVRPFLSGRDSHATHHENAAFRFEAEVEGDRVRWRPYEGVPEITAIGNGRYRTDPQWYRGFLYDEERARGLDAEEDLGAPGIFTWDLSLGPAVLLLGAGDALPGRQRRRPPWSPSWRGASTRAARGSARRSSAPATHISCAAATARPSSPAIPGSPTGAATPSSRCAVCVSRPAA